MRKEGRPKEQLYIYLSIAVDQATANIRLVAMSTGIMSAVPWKFPCMVRNKPFPIYKYKQDDMTHFLLCNSSLCNVLNTSAENISLKQK